MFTAPRPGTLAKTPCGPRTIRPVSTSLLAPCHGHTRQPSSSIEPPARSARRCRQRRPPRTASGRVPDRVAARSCDSARRELGRARHLGLRRHRDAPFAANAKRLYPARREPVRPRTPLLEQLLSSPATAAEVRGRRHPEPVTAGLGSNSGESRTRTLVRPLERVVRTGATHLHVRVGRSLHRGDERRGITRPGTATQTIGGLVVLSRA